jgi:ABC-type sugar transport system permease subunit
MKHKKKWIHYLTILLVALAAFGLRIRAVEMLPIDYDEDDYLLAGQKYARAMVEKNWGEISHYEYNLEHPPLVKLTYGLVLTALPLVPEVPERPTSDPPARSLPQPHFQILRLTSALFGSLEVVGVALLSPLAGLFLAIHTFTIKYTSQVMLEALPAFTSLLAVIAYSRNKAKRRLSGWMALSAVFLGMTAASKYLYAVAGVAIAIHWVWKERLWEWEGNGSRKIIPFLAWGGLSLGAFFLFNPFLWPDPLTRLKASISFNAAYSQGAQVEEAGLPFWQPVSWLFQSVPWHPGVFVFGLDAVIALFALLGWRRLWRKKSVFALWLLVGMAFLLVWPTKWPQYILVLTAPLSLSAAEGFKAHILEPARSWQLRWKAPGLARRTQPGREPVAAQFNWRGVRQALPWLLPGALLLSAIALFPLVFQSAMALTDFRAMAIKDGLTGGVWREVWLGLTRQVEPVLVEPFNTSLSRAKEVHYAGVSLLLNLLGMMSGDLLVFEVIWTASSIGLQLGLGLGVALILHRQGLLFRRGWQAIFILPWAIPEFVGALIWARMFEPRFGWLVMATSFKDTPGFSLAERLDGWQEQPNLALVVLLVAATWYGFPLMMLAASAALKMIPAEVYDAAALDGASGWGQFRWVTWPLMLPLLTPALIIRAIFAFNQFYLFYVLQTPYPLLTFATLSFYVFDTNSSFGGQFALSAALNVITVLLLVGFLLWFNRWAKAGEGVTYG